MEKWLTLNLCSVVCADDCSCARNHCAYIGPFLRSGSKLSSFRLSNFWLLLRFVPYHYYAMVLLHLQLYTLAMRTISLEWLRLSCYWWWTWLSNCHLTLASCTSSSQTQWERTSFRFRILWGLSWHLHPYRTFWELLWALIVLQCDPLIWDISSD